MSIKACLVAVSSVLLAAWSGSASAGTVKWITGSGTNAWSVGTNWSSGAAPTAGDDVVITNKSVGVLLTGDAPAAGWLSSLILSNNVKLVFSNWDTALSATNVWILNSAMVTCSGPFTNGVMSNNVVIVCSNLTVATGGRIDVNGRGFSGGLSALSSMGSGPGAGWVSPNPAYGVGGGHGGYGGGAYSGIPAFGGLPYGDPDAPLLPGSGGSFGGGGAASEGPGEAGGGAVRVNATGVVTVNGTITADGGKVVTSGTRAGAGSGGAIYITCGRITGTGSLSASGNNGRGTGYWTGSGGGRIAVVYNPSLQRAFPRPRLKFLAKAGMRSDIGTLSFPDGALLPTAPGTDIEGQICGFPFWSVDRLAFTNTWVRFAEDGFALTVTQNLVVAGSIARLQLGGSRLLVITSPIGQGREVQMPVPCNSNAFSSLTVGGNLKLTNGASLTLYSAPTGSMTSAIGAWLKVGGMMSVAPACWVYAQSHPTNGGSPAMAFGDVVTSPGGGFDAAGRGFSAGYNSDGFGPGGGDVALYQGGSYGGLSGRGGTTYGSRNAPVDPGSGGSASSGQGGHGGGLIHMDVVGSIIHNGTMNANGGNSFQYYHGSGGSGGGIYVQCRSISGTGSFSANGGNGISWNSDKTSGGGGGRIAVWWRKYDSFGGTLSATNGLATAGVPPTTILPYPGAIGTTVREQVPFKGTTITLQ